MNYELHDCYAHKFINYEIFRSFICNSFVFAKPFAIFGMVNNERISKECSTLTKQFIGSLLPFSFLSAAILRLEGSGDKMKS